MRGATVLSLRGGGPDPLGLVLPGSATVGTFEQDQPGQRLLRGPGHGRHAGDPGPGRLLEPGVRPRGQARRDPGRPHRPLRLRHLDVLRLARPVTPARSAWSGPTSTCCRAAPPTSWCSSRPGSCPGRSACSAPWSSTAPTAARWSATTPAGRRWTSASSPCSTRPPLMAGPIAQLQNVRNIIFPGTRHHRRSDHLRPRDLRRRRGLRSQGLRRRQRQEPGRFGAGDRHPGVGRRHGRGRPHRRPRSSPSCNRSSGPPASTSGIARIGSTGDTQFTMNLTSFAAGVTTGAQEPAAGGAVRHAPAAQGRPVERGQAAEHGQRAPGGGAGHAGPAHPGVPPAALPSGPGSWADGWRLLDPEDAQSVDSPATFYGLLQGIGNVQDALRAPAHR